MLRKTGACQLLRQSSTTQDICHVWRVFDCQPFCGHVQPRHPWGWVLVHQRAQSRPDPPFRILQISSLFIPNTFPPSLTLSLHSSLYSIQPCKSSPSSESTHVFQPYLFISTAPRLTCCSAIPISPALHIQSMKNGNDFIT